MDRPPSPSGPRTHAKMVCLTASTPSHRTAAPRATSGSRHPPSYAAAVITPHRAGYYDPLCAAMDPDDDNPFHDDSMDEVDQGAGEIEQGSPILLTNPAGIDAMTTDTAEVADASSGPGMATGNAPDTVVTAALPDVNTPGTKAALMADFALLLEKHVYPINSRLEELNSKIASNRGHITKRLFPTLEEKFASLEKSLATTTNKLEAKGVSLLAKFTALENTVSTVVEERLASLESAVALGPVLGLHMSGPQEPPEDPPPAATPGTVAVPGRKGVPGGTYAPPDDKAPRFCVGHGDFREEVAPPDDEAPRSCVGRGDVRKEVDHSPDDETIDVNTHTCLAYDEAWARNLSLCAGPPWTPS
jgi:hypothetical protein